MIPRIFSVALIAIGLASCDSGTKWESGKYEVYWIDTSDFQLGYKIDSGIVIGRVEGRVTAIGENDKWIVAERHPVNSPDKTEYFYISKAEDSPNKNADEIVQGPLGEKAFLEKKAIWGLPEFTHTF